MPGIRLLTVGPPDRYVLVQLHWTQFMFGVAFWRVRDYDTFHLMLGPVQIEYAWRPTAPEPRP